MFSNTRIVGPFESSVRERYWGDFVKYKKNDFFVFLFTIGVFPSPFFRFLPYSPLSNIAFSLCLCPLAYGSKGVEKKENGQQIYVKRVYMHWCAGGNVQVANTPTLNMGLSC